MSAKVAAVTGAGGFIGSHLVELLLKRGYEVRALAHYNGAGRSGHLEGVVKDLSAEEKARLTITLGDVCDRRCVDELVDGCDTVFHLAALIGIPYSYRAPESYVSVNISGTLNVLEACRNAGTKRLLHTSTSEVYGTAQTERISESHPLQGQSPYSASKISADKMVESYFRSFDLPAITVRPFNTYGPRQSLRAVIPTIICQALSDECDEVRLGSLTPERDLTYVTDTANAYILLAESNLSKVVGEVFNLGVGASVSIGELAEIVLKLLNSNKKIVSEETRVRPEKSEVLRLLSDHEKIRKTVDWKPGVSLEEGLQQTINWLDAHRVEWKSLVKEYVR